mmetsp:Transcript_5009/g.8803  ORF Transcript_5009/g.8803 Transcript_5009/m.8803 type:complete len:419 (-) Transcript_5009:507-1763(-)
MMILLLLLYAVFLTSSFFRLGHPHDSSNNYAFQKIIQHGVLAAAAAKTGASSCFVHASRMGSHDRPHEAVGRRILPLAFSARRFKEQRLQTFLEHNDQTYKHDSTSSLVSSLSEKPAWMGQTETYDNDNNTNKRKKNDAVEAYYLVWSPGVWKKMAMTSVVLGCGHVLWLFWFRRFGGKAMAGVGTTIMSATATTCHDEHNPQHGVGPVMLQTVVLPMLSSACCAIQLFVWNVLGWGCAGFNTVLGPLRPYFIPLFVYTHTVIVPRQQRPVMVLLSWTLTFLPELLHIWNKTKLLLFERKNATPLQYHTQTLQEPSRTILTTTTTKHNTTVPQPTTTRTTIDLMIPSMGCVACIRKIDSTLQGMEFVKEAQSWLQEGGGQASVTFDASSPSEADSKSRELVEAVRRAGFPTCTLQTPR